MGKLGARKMKWLIQVLELDGGGTGTVVQKSLCTHHPVLVPHPQLAGKGEEGESSVPTAF